MALTQAETEQHTRYISDLMSSAVNQLLPPDAEYVLMVRHKIDGKQIGTLASTFKSGAQVLDFIIDEFGNAGISLTRQFNDNNQPKVLPFKKTLLIKLQEKLGMPIRKYRTFGICDKEFRTAKDAAGDTYQTASGELYSTPLIFPDNPFNDEIKNAKHILDIGCGVGRNLPWIMENTDAIYYGLEPNKSMKKFFWEMQHPKYKSRVKLVDSVEKLAKFNVQFDVVVCTFVFQHLGYKYSDAADSPYMSITDITKKIRALCREGAVWIMYEHDWEEQWIDRWTGECNVNRLVYLRDYVGIPKLAERGPHHLIIWKN